MKNPKKSKDNKPKLNNVYAVIFYSNNKNPDLININNYKECFHHNNRTYFITYDDVMTMKVHRYLVRHDFYLFYFYDNQKPIRINENELKLSTKEIPNKTIHTIMMSEALSKVEKSNNMFSLDNIDIKVVIGIGVAIVIAWYFLSGGSLT